MRTSRGCHRRRLVLEPLEQRALLSGDVLYAADSVGGGACEGVVSELPARLSAERPAVLAEADDENGSFSPADEEVFAMWTYVGPQSIADGPDGEWVQIDFQAQAAIPPGARVTEVMVYHEILHPHSGDIDVQVSNASHTWAVRDHQGGDTANIDETVTEESLFAGDAAAQTWSYRVRDTMGGQTGTLDVVQVFVFYDEVSVGGEIHGSVWNDLDADGERDPDEPGLANRRVFIDANEDGHWAPGELDEFTDGLGDYAFTGLVPGDYVVRSYGPEGWQPTYPGPASWNQGGPADAGTAKAWYDSVTGEFTVSANNVRGWALVSSGLFRDDVDPYITQNSDLPTRPFGTFVSKNVNVVGEDSLGDPLTYDGISLGAILDPTLCFLEARALVAKGEVFLDYFPFAGEAATGAVIVGPMEVRHGIAVAPQQIVTGVDFGSHALPSEIHGTVFDDLNGNGRRDGHERRMSDWKVYLDENRNGSWDIGEPFEMTDTTGHYIFGDVSPGTYFVGEVLQTSWHATSPANAIREVVVAPHRIVSGIDFANRLSAVVGRHVFYNNSAFDGNNAVPNADDDHAVALDKQALLSGATASFENYTSYGRGINGIMVDVAGLPDGYALDVAHFEFKVGNSDDPSNWLPAAEPVAITLREDVGVDGSDRITVIWADNAIRNTWLQVTALAVGLGLPEDDIFYFGNAVGEAGDVALNTLVTTTDVLLARNNPRNFLDPAEAGFPYDYNRDRRVDATDVLLARNNQTNFLTALKLIDLSASEDQGHESKVQAVLDEEFGLLPNQRDRKVHL